MGTSFTTDTLARKYPADDLVRLKLVAENDLGCDRDPNSLRSEAIAMGAVFAFYHNR
jgi:hypothetical protein